MQHQLFSDPAKERRIGIVDPRLTNDPLHSFFTIITTHHNFVPSSHTIRHIVEGLIVPMVIVKSMKIPKLNMYLEKYSPTYNQVHIIPLSIMNVAKQYKRKKKC
jgi:hypothetical protein